MKNKSVCEHCGNVSIVKEFDRRRCIICGKGTVWHKFDTREATATEKRINP